jgi:hypothetical protein
VTFATSKSPVVKNTIFPHPDIHKHTWFSPDGATHNQIDHILIDTRGIRVYSMYHLSRELSDTDHYLVIAKVTKSHRVGKTAQKFDVEIFNLRNLCELKVTQQCQIKTSNRFAALENLNDSEDINTAGEYITEDIKNLSKRQHRSV